MNWLNPRATYELFFHVNALRQGNEDSVISGRHLLLFTGGVSSGAAALEEGDQ